VAPLLTVEPPLALLPEERRTVEPLPEELLFVPEERLTVEPLPVLPPEERRTVPPEDLLLSCGLE